MSDPGDSEEAAYQEIDAWNRGEGPGMGSIFALMFFGFFGIVALGIGASFFASVLFDAPPPFRAEEVEVTPVDPLKAPITEEEIDTRWRKKP